MNTLLNINGNLIDARFIVGVSDIVYSEYEYSFIIFTPVKNYTISCYVFDDYDINDNTKIEIENISGVSNGLYQLLSKFKEFLESKVNDVVSKSILSHITITTDKIYNMRDELVKFRNSVLEQDNTAYIINGAKIK